MKVKSKMCFTFITYGLCNLSITVEAFFKYAVFFFFFCHCPLFNVQAQFPADVFPSCLRGNLTWDISGVFDIAVNVFLIDMSMYFSSICQCISHRYVNVFLIDMSMYLSSICQCIHHRYLSSYKPPDQLLIQHPPSYHISSQ